MEVLWCQKCSDLGWVAWKSSRKVKIMAEILLIIGCVVLMLIGLVGIVVPVLPDLVLI